jgi:hypothetical protein
VDVGERDAIGVALDHAGSGARRQRAGIDDEPHRRLLLVEESIGIDACARTNELHEALGRFALASGTGIGEVRIAESRVPEGSPGLRIDASRVGELVEHGLHEHAALWLELELAADHAVGLHPEPPELIAPMAVGSGSDTRPIDAVARLPSDSACCIGVQRLALGDHGVQLGLEHGFIGIAAGVSEPGADRAGDLHRQGAAGHRRTQRGKPRRRGLWNRLGDRGIGPALPFEVCSSIRLGDHLPDSDEGGRLALR